MIDHIGYVHMYALLRLHALQKVWEILTPEKYGNCSVFLALSTEY